MNKARLCRNSLDRKRGAALRANRARILAGVKPPELCEGCGKPPGAGKRLSQHHPDYDELDRVEWLCRPCHAIADNERRARERAAAATPRSARRARPERDESPVIPLEDLAIPAVLRALRLIA